MRRKGIRRIHAQAAGVIVIALTTAPSTLALAGGSNRPPVVRAAPNAECRAEQVVLRITKRKLHVTVLAAAGRSVALVYATDPAGTEWTILPGTETLVNVGGIAHIRVDFHEYENDVVWLAIVTSEDPEWRDNLHATEPVEVVLRDGHLYAPPVEDPKGGMDAIKGGGVLKGFTAVGGEKGIVIATKGGTGGLGNVLEPPRGGG
jgi:hypothetical protein